MESLLRQLANDHPPGPMPDLAGGGTGGMGETGLPKAGTSGAEAGAGAGAGGPLSTSAGTGAGAGAGSGMTLEQEQAAFEKAVQMLLSGEGLEALGLSGDDLAGGLGGLGQGAEDKDTANGQAADLAALLASTSLNSKSQGAGSEAGGKMAMPIGVGANAGPSKSASGSGSGSGTKPDSKAPAASFEETIKRTMASLDSAGDKHKSKQKNGLGGLDGLGGAGAGGDDIAALLAQLQNDPSFLDGLGEGGEDGEDGDFGGLLDGMMSQLMTREVLEEPMAELASKVSRS